MSDLPQAFFFEFFSFLLAPSTGMANCEANEAPSARPPSWLGFLRAVAYSPLYVTRVPAWMLGGRRVPAEYCPSAPCTHDQAQPSGWRAPTAKRRKRSPRSGRSRRSVSFKVFAFASSFASDPRVLGPRDAPDL